MPAPASTIPTAAAAAAPATATPAAPSCSRSPSSWRRWFGRAEHPADAAQRGEREDSVVAFVGHRHVQQHDAAGGVAPDGLREDRDALDHLLVIGGGDEQG